MDSNSAPSTVSSSPESRKGSAPAADMASHDTDTAAKTERGGRVAGMALPWRATSPTRAVMPAEASRASSASPPITRSTPAESTIPAAVNSRASPAMCTATDRTRRGAGGTSAGAIRLTAGPPAPGGRGGPPGAGAGGPGSPAR